MKPTLLIMAAGIGNRYGGLKQIDPVGPNGEIIIDYSIYDAIRAGFGKVVFVIRHDFEKAFREKIGNKFEGVIDIHYAFQDLDAHTGDFQVPSDRVKPWGTGQALLVAADAINEPFIVINADDFYGRHSYQIMADYLLNHGDSEPEYGMVGYILRNTLSKYGFVSRGVCETNGNGNLLKVTERKRIAPHGSGGARFVDPEGKEHILSGDETVSMNFWGFKPSIFPHMERQFEEFLHTRGNDPKSEFYIPTSLDELVEEDIAHVRVLKTEDSWFGVTYREDKKHAIRSIRELINQGVYPEKLWDRPALKKRST